MYEPGVVKGEERRDHVAADLRHMREAFDEVTQHEADLAEELLEAARRKTKQKTKPPPSTPANAAIVVLLALRSM